ncbi:MAG: response regulator, partial [Pontibacterium sp.]
RGSHPEKSLSGAVIVLLDLNMPRMNGFEFLEELRADQQLKRTIVFVLTTSNDDTDRARAYENAIAGYMVKSQVGPQFKKLTQLINSYQQTVSFP